MKLALLGTGKTGHHVLSLSKEMKIKTRAFNSKHKVTSSLLQSFDVILSFLSPAGFLHLYPTLLDSKKPLVNATTGFNFPKDIDLYLKQNKTFWIHGNNFSPMMMYIKRCFDILNSLKQIEPSLELSIFEAHHKNKVDGPSGTALMWRKWLKQVNDSVIPITFDRREEILGIHQLNLKTKDESLSFKHTVKDRSVFAKGALICAHYFYQNPLSPGFYYYDNISSLVEKP